MVTVPHNSQFHTTLNIFILWLVAAAVVQIDPTLHQSLVHDSLRIEKIYISRFIIDFFYFLRFFLSYRRNLVGPGGLSRSWLSQFDHHS